MPEPILFLAGDITPEIAENITEYIYRGFTGTLLINSAGGDVYSALAIYDALLRSGEVNTAGTGLVASAANIVLLGGKQRFATPNTRFQIHSPVLLAPASSSVEKEERDAIHQITEQLFAQRTRLTPDEAKELLSKESFFGFKRAKEIGLIQEAF
jgi:ATP-dependent protease ClpP protease subunit